jgi:hypothetical protein
LTVAVLDRPVFILAPPRSGSTLLFETLCQSSQIWSLGDEGHGIIERHRELRPRPFSTDSNRLLASQCTPLLAEEIIDDFRQLIRDREGRSLAGAGEETVRLLEKTPKNILRIPFLLRLFPDARFIYFYRDARDNISSIMDGWLSGRFVTYNDKQTKQGHWSFLVPPKWHEHAAESLAGIATFQWAACHQYAMQDLANLESSRWCSMNYAEFIGDTELAVERLCEFMEVPVDEALRLHCRGSLPTSRYTLSQPAEGKWRRHAHTLAPHMVTARAMSKQINTFVSGRSLPLETALSIETATAQKISRNQICPCGSGKKYKLCHGGF